MNIEKYFTDSATIQTFTESTTGWGGDGSWADTETINCLIRPLSGNERYAADKKTVFSTHRMYCDTMTLTESQRVKHDSKYYDIKFVQNPMNFNRFYQVDLELIE